MLPFKNSQQAYVHEKHQQDTTQEPNVSGCDQNSYSNKENLELVNEESRKRPHPDDSSILADDISHETHQVELSKYSEKEGDLKAVELDCNAEKISINYLINDDCLSHIFSFLPNRDLIRIEQVCKRWQKVSLESWRNVKFVKIYRDFGISVLRPTILEQILSRCGKYIIGLEFKCNQNIVKAHNLLITSRSILDEVLIGFHQLHEIIDTDEYTSNLRRDRQLRHPDEAIKLINKYCQKLSYLNIFHAFMNPEKSYLDFLDANILKNLKSLSIGNYNFKDDQLSEVLKKCVNLTEFNLTGYVFGHRINELMHLPESVTTLSVAFSKTFSDIRLDEVLEKYTNLENLDISGTFVVASTLVEFTKQLKCLALWDMKYFFNKGDIEVFVNGWHCPNLRMLDVSYNGSSFTGKILSALVNCCPKIEDLRLKMCENLEDADFNVLKKLENLMYLDVCFTRISNETLIDLSETSGKLKKLECYGCHNVNSNGISKVIAASPELTYLFFSKSELTKKLIEFALLSLQGRHNEVDLTICINEKNRRNFASNIPGLIEELELKSISYKCRGKNVMRIVYGSSICDCNFQNTCLCLNGFNTIAYFG